MNMKYPSGRALNERFFLTTLFAPRAFTKFGPEVPLKSNT